MPRPTIGAPIFKKTIMETELSTIQHILNQLNIAVKGSEEVYYTDKELRQFAHAFESKWTKETSDDEVADAFLEYWWDTDRPVRRCSVCGRLMRDDYCSDMGASYYCSDECLLHDYSDMNEWEKECQNNDQSYYTEWY